MKKVLVIDDDADILYVVQAVLEMEGYEVVALSTAEEAEQEVGRHHPDLIILDIMIGPIDGRTICKLLKNALASKAIPILLFSASGMPEEQLLNCGAEAFIAKPFDIDELSCRVSQMLQRGTVAA